MKPKEMTPRRRKALEEFLLQMKLLDNRLEALAWKELQRQRQSQRRRQLEKVSRQAEKLGSLLRQKLSK